MDVFIKGKSKKKRRLEDWVWEWAETKGLPMNQEGEGADKVSIDFWSSHAVAVNMITHVPSILALAI